MATTVIQRLGQLTRSKSDDIGTLDHALGTPNQLLGQIGSASHVGRELDCSCGVAVEGRLGQAYNEEAFRYFLEIEQKRSERSQRPFLLLLVDLKKNADTTLSMDAKVAAKLFSALWLSLRETDFTGWFRDGRVAGAVLTQLADVHGTDIRERISQRVSRALCEGLPSHDSSRFDVRVHRLPSVLNGRD